MNRWIQILGVVLACAAGSPNFAAEIPDRPEKLQFPPLKYEPPRAADFRVVLKAGPVAYVVPDRELPLVNISVLVRVGDHVVPAGKEGLARLAGYLIANSGTASRTAEELEERLAFLAAQLSSAVADTQGSVGLSLLSKDLDEGLAILREVMTAPRWQEDKIALRKQQALQSMKERNDDSSAIERRELGFLAYGESFFVNRQTTAASLEGITKDDISGFHKKYFHPANFVVSVSGDFEREAMIAKLEKLFADWPFKGETAPPIPTDVKMAEPGVYVVNKDVNQGRVSVALPGIKTDDPDYFAGDVMNDILGGGGFTSRIMSRVRSDEGLAYSAGSALPGGTYYPLAFRAAFQSKSRTVAYATSLVLEEMRKMAAQPVTDEELKTAKQSSIETFPRTFASKRATAGVFAQDEFTGRYAKNPTYWQTYRDKIAAVTTADVQRVAKRLLDPDKAVILIVGEKKEIVLGHPNHTVKLEELSKGKLHSVPLRDPLTMKPMAAE